MKRSTKGFYTVEAAIFLPFVILTVLSLGYFMKIDGMWENCVHGAVDETSMAASKAYDKGVSFTLGAAVKSRIQKDNPHLDHVEISNVRPLYRDRYADNVTFYRINATEKLSLPLGFQREFCFSSDIKYRGFIGEKEKTVPMGSEGLERFQKEDPVCIFPQSGEKYHHESCTYVKAAVESAVLSDRLKRKYDACSLCSSGTLPAGSLVFCFQGEDTAYHRGTCSSIVRHTAVIDRTEAVKRGYEPCSKCGGG